jgi:hypothetical protein
MMPSRKVVLGRQQPGNVPTVVTATNGDQLRHRRWERVT